MMFPISSLPRHKGLKPFLFPGKTPVKPGEKIIIGLWLKVFWFYTRFGLFPLFEKKGQKMNWGTGGRSAESERERETT